MKKIRLLKMYVLMAMVFLSTSYGWGQVVISQVYGGGGNLGATYTHDFIELFNLGSTSVDITGWSVQYASATGSTWAVTNLTSVTLAPGQYYLIQEAQGGGGTTPLPTPDAIGTIPMSGTAGKVALVNNTTALTGTCPTGANILDFVGFGTTANCYEGSGPTPAPSNTLAVLRVSNGCTDTNNNATDFATGTPDPRNTSSPLNSCSTLTVATPTFAPPAGVYTTAQNIVISTTTVGASIYYTTDGSEPTTSSTPYTVPVNINTTTTLKARAYKDGMNPSLVATGLYIFPINVANLAALRAGALGQHYKVTGEVVLTFQQTFRNQKYIQDATAAILIDDLAGIITSTYSVNDGITGIIGTLNEFGNMMQFTPLTNPGNATSNNNTITPQVITLDQLSQNFEDYESELVKIMNVTFTNAGGTFANGVVYPITDGSKAIFNFRTTFFDVDYIGQIIPTNANITVLPNSRTEGDFVTSRSLADIQALSNPPTKLVITSVNNGANPYTNMDFSVTVQTQDAFGNPAFPASNINFTFTTNGGTGGNVTFAPGSAISGTVVSGTSQVVVTGVKMAPAGTNVTLTASDNNPFGLQSGTSTPFNVVDFVIPNIIICEIMQDPFAVSDANGEWFEVYNAGNSPVDMNGWIIKDDGTNTHTISSSIIVPAQGFAVLGRNANSTTNGGYTCNYQYSSTDLGNSDDEIVLLLPDGVTEVDRVNYTGVTPWVDPTGASMIFAGLPTDNNNDGTKWIVSTLREPSYTGTEGDLGSPGSLGTGQFTGLAGFNLNLKVFLEGPYNTTTNLMATDLVTNNLIPLSQPFNPALPYYGNNTPKWLYNGTQTVTSFPAGTVDYVLIELRDATSAAAATSATRIARIPALLKSDGSIVGLDGTSLPDFTGTVNDFLYIIIWNRNHVGIMSSANITPSGTVVYDFTTGSDKVVGGAAGYKLLETGVWGMVAGDINADGQVNADDKSPLGWKVDAGKKGYYGTDLNLNIQVNNKDKNEFLYPNFIYITQVPN
jgi:hypothetical protein